MGQTVRDKAKRLGVSKTTAARWAKEGKLPGPTPPSPPQPPLFGEEWPVGQETDHGAALLALTVERTRLTAAQAEDREIDLRVKSGELVLADDVKKVAYECGRRHRDRVLAVLPRMAFHLTPETRALLKKELYLALGATGQRKRKSS